MRERGDLKVLNHDGATFLSEICCNAKLEESDLNDGKFMSESIKYQINLNSGIQKIPKRSLFP